MMRPLTDLRPDPVAATCDRMAIERLLNTWLRETAGAAPVAGAIHTLVLGDEAVLAPCLRASPAGFHTWGPLRLRRADGRTTPLDDPAELARRMVDALAPEATPVREATKRRILDGLDRARDHAVACAGRNPDRSPAGLEQSLWHGHPFHPLAKSVDGFTQADAAAYAPERGATFALRWFLADPDLVASQWRDAGAEAATRPALVALSGLSPERIGGRWPIPSHPWQAARLAADPTVMALITEGRLELTPPCGASVRPTSSVRTVFCPSENLFLKLPIAARITNFARTNSREHLARSLAAARALRAAPDAVAAAGLDILSERGALALDRPELEAITGILVREGPSRKAFVVAGLLEPSPRDGRPILAEMGCDLTGLGEAAAWIEAYARVAVLPPLRLFATTGIGLEAHAQNSLLALEDGRPARLVVRDLEGVSIDAAIFARLAPDHGLDPAVRYSAEEAWARLVYYLVVNQVSHVVATVARAAGADEAPLWATLAQALAAADEAPEVRALIERLLAAETLPAKANLASCLAGRGERPDYVALPNPLRAGRGRPEAAAWDAAGQRVAEQLLGALLHEDLLPGSVVRCEGSDAALRLTLTPSAGAPYNARARRMHAYGRVLVEPGSLTVAEGPVTDAGAFLAALLPHLPGGAADHARFAEELARTQHNHAEALVHGAGRPLGTLAYDALEGALPDGHRYHPCFKSRIGFSPADNRAYGPEFGAPVHPVWIAAHRSLAEATSMGVSGGQDPDLLALSLDLETRARFVARIVAAGGHPQDFHWLPVHPWQWDRVGEGATAPQRRAGTVIVLGTARHAYGAQQSIRTLADRTAPEAPSLKLALSIRNTSTARTLAPHTVLNAPRISAWLTEVVAGDPYLSASGTLLLAERMGVAVTLPDDPGGTLRGALSAIWRDPVAPHLGDEAAVPFTALTHRDGADPFITPWIARHGAEPWVDALLQAALLPVMHLLLVQGIAVESHQQNMVLLHRDGWPTRVALKDFHDGVRFIPEHLPGPRPALVPTPAEHARVNPNSYVEARDVEDVRDFVLDALLGVNLAELGWCLERWFGYAETRFWDRVVETLRRHCAAFPAARAGARRYRIAAETLVVEDLARRRLDPAGASGRRRPNPLAPLAASLEA
ncbi:IucA/IucC family protein [Methylobacterium gossipiicola]|uniref:Siderophore synthetase component n=1 Tax=Methylobacterium gossipiicola TaxID=582675 RepID=A0A1I2VJ75_9HYPH|nr:IucA/IucC family protein [Methylobacterium gossipiicola]SFG89354.1 Siderophore synthetase component [Methylobacterium gossipiicola]